jgi:hypothetical protein
LRHYDKGEGRKYCEGRDVIPQELEIYQGCKTELNQEIRIM